MFAVPGAKLVRQVLVWLVGDPDDLCSYCNHPRWRHLGSIDNRARSCWACHQPDCPTSCQDFVERK